VRLTLGDRLLTVRQPTTMGQTAVSTLGTTRMGATVPVGSSITRTSVERSSASALPAGGGIH
jgi:hypothetical protein